MSKGADKFKIDVNSNVLKESAKLAKRGTGTTWIIAAVTIAIIATISLLFYINAPKKQIIGGDRDEHGCLGPAGYSWNQQEKECVRQWVQGEERYQVTNFQTCLDANYPIQESEPRKCTTLSGRTFTEETCQCPQGYRQEGEACNPQCYYSQPPCMTPSIICS